LETLADAVGTPIAVQQKMMRYTDIRTTLNVYGDVMTDEMAWRERRSHNSLSKALEGKRAQLADVVDCSPDKIVGYPTRVLGNPPILDRVELSRTIQVVQLIPEIENFSGLALHGFAWAPAWTGGNDVVNVSSPRIVCRKGMRNEH